MKGNEEGWSKRYKRGRRRGRLDRDSGYNQYSVNTLNIEQNGSEYIVKRQADTMHGGGARPMMRPCDLVRGIEGQWGESRGRQSNGVGVRRRWCEDGGTTGDKGGRGNDGDRCVV
jgi:hypothetical protein